MRRRLPLVGVFAGRSEPQNRCQSQGNTATSIIQRHSGHLVLSLALCLTLALSTADAATSMCYKATWDYGRKSMPLSPLLTARQCTVLNDVVSCPGPGAQWSNVETATPFSAFTRTGNHTSYLMYYARPS